MHTRCCDTAQTMKHHTVNNLYHTSHDHLQYKTYSTGFPTLYIIPHATLICLQTQNKSNNALDSDERWGEGDREKSQLLLNDRGEREEETGINPVLNWLLDCPE